MHTAEEKERKKARTWVFFLILIHISACVLYGMALVLLPRDIVLPTVGMYSLFDIFDVTLPSALMLGFYFGFRLLSVGIFCLRRIRNHCCKVPYDPENINLDDYGIPSPLDISLTCTLHREHIGLHSCL
jgi:hypothetical protein